MDPNSAGTATHEGKNPFSKHAAICRSIWFKPAWDIGAWSAGLDMGTAEEPVRRRTTGKTSPSTSSTASTAKAKFTYKTPERKGTKSIKSSDEGDKKRPSSLRNTKHEGKQRGRSEQKKSTAGKHPKEHGRSKGHKKDAKKEKSHKRETHERGAKRSQTEDKKSKQEEQEQKKKSRKEKKQKEVEPDPPKAKDKNMENEAELAKLNQFERGKEIRARRAVAEREEEKARKEKEEEDKQRAERERVEAKKRKAEDMKSNSSEASAECPGDEVDSSDEEDVGSEESDVKGFKATLTAGNSPSDADCDVFGSEDEGEEEEELSDDEVGSGEEGGKYIASVEKGAEIQAASNAAETKVKEGGAVAAGTANSASHAICVSFKPAHFAEMSRSVFCIDPGCTHKKEWDVFSRQLKNKKKMPGSLAEHVQKNKVDLFNLWLEKGQDLHELLGIVVEQLPFH